MKQWLFLGFLVSVLISTGAWVFYEKGVSECEKKQATKELAEATKSSEIRKEAGRTAQKAIATHGMYSAFAKRNWVRD